VQNSSLDPTSRDTTLCMLVVKERRPHGLADMALFKDDGAVLDALSLLAIDQKLIGKPCFATSPPQQSIA